MWILSRTVADSVQKTCSQGRLYIALNGGFRYREEGNLYGQLHVGEPALGCHLVVNGKMNSDNNYPDMWWRVVVLVTLTTTVTKFVDFCNFHRLVTCSTLFDSKFCHLGAVFWMWKLKALLTLTSKDTVEKRSVSSDGCENVKVQEVRNDKKISALRWSEKQNLPQITTFSFAFYYRITKSFRGVAWWRMLTVGWAASFSEGRWVRNQQRCCVGAFNVLFPI